MRCCARSTNSLMFWTGFYSQHNRRGGGNDLSECGDECDEFGGRRGEEMEAEELDELIEVLRTDCLYETVEERGEDIGWLVASIADTTQKVLKVEDQHRDFV